MLLLLSFQLASRTLVLCYNVATAVMRGATWRVQLCRVVCGVLSTAVHVLEDGATMWS